MNEYSCQRCGDSDQELRTLHISCGYQMEELKIPFELFESNYILKVCKSCRADCMKAIKHWFENPIKEISCGSGIFIRELGAIREITEEEFEIRHPGRTPVRMLENKDESQ